MRFLVALLMVQAAPALASNTILEVRLPWAHNRWVAVCQVVNESANHVAKLDCNDRGTMTITADRATERFPVCDQPGMPLPVSASHISVAGDDELRLPASACRESQSEGANSLSAPEEP